MSSNNQPQQGAQQAVSMQLISLGGCTFNPVAIAGINWLLYPKYFPAVGIATPDETIHEQTREGFAESVTIMLIGGGEFDFTGSSANDFFIWFLQATGRARIVMPGHDEQPPANGQQPAPAPVYRR